MKALLKITFTLSILLNVSLSKAQDHILDWVKSIEGSSMSRSIEVDAFGNIYTTGHFNETADFDPGMGTYNLTSMGFADIFIQKSDSNGNFMWAKSMGGTGEDFGHSITADASGNIYITGYFSGIVDFDPGVGTYNLTSAGYADAFIQKLDANGNFIWAKSMGGPNSEIGYSIVVDEFGNVYTTGIFQGIADFDPGAGTTNLNSIDGLGVFIQKIDASGNFLWAKEIPAVTIGSVGAINYGFSIALGPNGGVYTTGSFTGIADFDPGMGTHNLTAMGGQDVFIQKLDTDGNFIWAKSMGGTLYDVGLSITVDPDGNIYTTGAFEKTVDFDPGTGTYNLTALGLNDIFIQKLDANGNFLWTKTIGNTSYARSLSITLDATGNIYTTGYFTETLDFDPGVGTSSLSAIGYEDIYIQKLDANGDFLWATSMGGISSDFGYAIKVDPLGHIYTTGYFNATVDFDPEVGTYNLTATGGGNNAFIQKLKDSLDVGNIGINPFSDTKSIHIYPNPTHGKISIENKKNEIQSITITDIHGKIIQQHHISHQNIDIDLSHEAKGLYFLNIKMANQIRVKKVLLK